MSAVSQTDSSPKLRQHSSVALSLPTTPRSASTRDNGLIGLLQKRLGVQSFMATDTWPPSVHDAPMLPRAALSRELRVESRCCICFSRSRSFIASRWWWSAFTLRGMQRCLCSWPRCPLLVSMFGRAHARTNIHNLTRAQDASSKERALLSLRTRTYLKEENMIAPFGQVYVQRSSYVNDTSLMQQKTTGSKQAPVFLKRICMYVCYLLTKVFACESVATVESRLYCETQASRVYDLYVSFFM